MGYRALREMFNYGARFASPMAWNGSNGINAGQPGYVSFTAWRNTPLEDAMRDFAVAHAFVPVGTRLWTFGSSQYADPDGWSASAGAKLAAGPGLYRRYAAGWRGDPRFTAPLALARGETDLLVLGLDVAAIGALEVEARASDGAWVTLASNRSAGDLQVTSAGVSVPLAWPRSLRSTDQIRISLQLRANAAPVRLRHIALYPSQEQMALEDPVVARAEKK